MSDWFSANDKLPKLDGTPVLIVSEGEVFRAVPCITWRDPDDLNECAEWRDGEYADVTHWMPIPRLPREKRFNKSYADYENIGDGNLGHRNTGCGNLGNHNSGDHNVGDWNTGCFNNGAFCESDDIFIKMFDRPTNWTLRDWKNSKACKVLETAPYSVMMSEKELTALTQKWWDNLSSEEREEIYHLPNFGARKFERIMHGISIGLEVIPFSDEQ